MSLDLDLTGYEPCPFKWHHTCIIDGNPEFWPIIGGVVTQLTDVIGHITGKPVMNGYYGFALLIALIVSTILLIRKFARKQWNEFLTLLHLKYKSRKRK